jgi:hypothetical protein
MRYRRTIVRRGRIAPVDSPVDTSCRKFRNGTAAAWRICHATGFQPMSSRQLIGEIVQTRTVHVKRQRDHAAERQLRNPSTGASMHLATGQYVA